MTGICHQGVTLGWLQALLPTQPNEKSSTKIKLKVTQGMKLPQVGNFFTPWEGKERVESQHGLVRPPHHVINFCNPKLSAHTYLQNPSEGYSPFQSCPAPCVRESCWCRRERSESNLRAHLLHKCLCISWACHTHGNLRNKNQCFCGLFWWFI